MYARYVDEQSTLLRTLISLENKKLEALIEKQNKLIDSQARKIKSLESRLGKPKREAAQPTEYRPSMRLS